MNTSRDNKHKNLKREIRNLGFFVAYKDMGLYCVVDLYKIHEGNYRFAITFTPYYRTIWDRLFGRRGRELVRRTFEHNFIVPSEIPIYSLVYQRVSQFVREVVKYHPKRTNKMSIRIMNNLTSYF